MFVASLDNLYLLKIKHYSGSGAFSLNITSFPVIPGDSSSNPVIIDHRIDDQTIYGELPLNEYYHDVWYLLNLNGSYEFKLNGDEGTDFASTRNVKDDILAITSVHPMREDAVEELLKRAGAEWDVVEDLVTEEKITKVKYRGNNFYLRNFKIDE